MPLTQLRRRSLKQPLTFFCDRQHVSKALSGKSIALVGSGPGCLDNSYGFVDSHDVVVRVNNYKLSKFTGKRTDVFYSFFGTSIKKPAKQLQADGVKLCICKCPNDRFMDSDWHTAYGKTNGVDFRYIYKNRKAWWFCPTYVPTVEEFLESFKLLGDHVPTTGFSALLDILAHNPKSVYMTGFDFFSSGIHNVDERWTPRNENDPIGHRPDTERQWLKMNRDSIPVTMDKKLMSALK